jgi:hypothetical protein
VTPVVFQERALIRIRRVKNKLVESKIDVTLREPDVLLRIEG